LAVTELQAAGVEVRLLSGDRPGPVRRIAGDAGITHYRASCLPDEKLDCIRAAQDGGLPVGMAGDGINDAPALAAADVGMAVGAGTDLAKQAGNVVLMGDQLMSIPWLIRLSRKARSVVMQNLLWALGYNLIAISAAVAGLLHPLLAALAMVISSLTVVSNSARLSGFPGLSNAESLEGQEAPSAKESDEATMGAR
jgi:P-type E1-E2 ATPase